MLLTSKLNYYDVGEIISQVSHDYYQGNLCGTGWKGDLVRRDGRVETRFTLAVENSFGPGARTSASGRHMPKASWQAHAKVMAAIFDRDPDAILKTVLATYKGAADFHSKYRATGDHNVGSRMEPRAIRDTSV